MKSIKLALTIMSSQSHVEQTGRGVLENCMVTILLSLAMVCTSLHQLTYTCITHSLYSYPHKESPEHCQIFLFYHFRARFIKFFLRKCTQWNKKQAIKSQNFSDHFLSSDLVFINFLHFRLLFKSHWASFNQTLAQRLTGCRGFKFVKMNKE